ncbi:hypothetical protein G5B40_11545 [Pikeienuella piscinae]|uniref:Uncharacterized protein n=1 Tax=Pikeienuella piscinae TaxID=2748098 RepID=A0A7L5C2D3_9RHOB|nr:hypothetical protein [Pikeienuella piscinae]QIE56029.1 hypothetical protein G5B40_11545 [Pikeienuella piscinae]
MSFVIAFDRFMRVRVSDDGGAPVEGLAFAPTARTREVMANHEILHRPSSDGFSLYYKSRPGVTPPLRAPITSRVRFSFGIHVTTPGFFARHHPDFGAGGAQILLDNLTPAGAVTASGALSAGATVEAADLTALGPRAYPVRLDISGGAPGVIEARDQFSTVVAASTIIDPPPGATEIFATVDLSNAQDAAFRLVAPAPAALDRPIYADDELADSGPVGVVDLYWEQPQSAVPTGTGAEYAIVFRLR